MGVSVGGGAVPANEGALLCVHGTDAFLVVVCSFVLSENEKANKRGRRLRFRVGTQISVS